MRRRSTHHYCLPRTPPPQSCRITPTDDKTLNQKNSLAASAKDLLTVHEVPPATGLTSLVEDGSIRTQPAELDIVKVLPGGASVVHLAESINVGIAPASDLINTTRAEVNSNIQTLSQDLKDVCGTMARMG